MFNRKKKEKQKAERAVILDQFDGQLKNTETITNIFNKMAALDNLRSRVQQTYLDSIYGKRSNSSFETELMNRYRSISGLERKTVRDNYDAINDSGLSHTLFGKFEHLKGTFDAVTLERALENKASAVSTPKVTPQTARPA